jgi:hypothetical protein
MLIKSVSDVRLIGEPLVSMSIVIPWIVALQFLVNIPVTCHITHNTIPGR